MKKQKISTFFTAIIIVTALTSAGPLAAQDSPAASTTVTTDHTAPALAYGTANVLKLAEAKVGDETIIAYIEKSGEGYGSLGASEIIYLRDHGVSDRVLKTMLTQEKNARDATLAQSAAQPVAAAAAPAAVIAAPQYQQAYAPPPFTYVQTAPAPLIVMRDSSPRLADYGIYPRYGYGYSYGYGCYPGYGYRSYGYYYPQASFSMGFGGHHGGFRGGYCR